MRLAAILRPMKALTVLVLMAVMPFSLAQQRPRDIDPNTKIEGGADVRSSGANAGAGTSTEDKIEPEKSPPRPPGEPRIEERRDPDQDKPTSERKPQERDEETFKPSTRK